MNPEIMTRRDFLFGAMAIPVLSAMATGFAPVRQTADGNLLELDATAVLALLSSGELKSETYAETLLKQCRKMRALNAFIWQNEQQVLEDARAADLRRQAGKTGALHGLPVLLKDNIDTAHAPTSAGTPALRDNRPRSDAAVAASLFSSGAILLGKTNMHELAWSITSNNAAFGAVHNPYNAQMISGGSSGGNGAAIAARMCPAGLGTDTGGSVRIPSALCGIVGLRPTSGRYSSKGIVPYSHTRDTVGPMARSVRDLILFDSIVTGNHSPVAAANLKGLRIGIPRGYFFVDLDADLSPVVDSALTKLSDAGCVLIQAEIPRLQELFSSAATPISYYEVRRDLARYLRDSGSPLTLEQLEAQIASPDIKNFFATQVIGPQAPTQQAYDTAMKETRPALQEAYRRYFRDHNLAAIAYPTTVLPARPIGEDDEVELNGKKASTFSTYLHNTRAMTIAGIAGLSLPIGQTSGGLPVGLELDCLWGKDRVLLSMGLALEKLFGALPAPPLI